MGNCVCVGRESQKRACESQSTGRPKNPLSARNRPQTLACCVLQRFGGGVGGMKVSGIGFEVLGQCMKEARATTRAPGKGASDICAVWIDPGD